MAAPLQHRPAAQQPGLPPASPGSVSTAIADLRFRFAPPPTGNGGGDDDALTINPDHPVGVAHRPRHQFRTPALGNLHLTSAIRSCANIVQTAPLRLAVTHKISELDYRFAKFGYCASRTNRFRRRQTKCRPQRGAHTLLNSHCSASVTLSKYAASRDDAARFICIRESERAVTKTNLREVIVGLESVCWKAATVSCG